MIPRPKPQKNRLRRTMMFIVWNSQVLLKCKKMFLAISDEGQEKEYFSQPFCFVFMLLGAVGEKKDYTKLRGRSVKKKTLA